MATMLPDAMHHSDRRVPVMPHTTLGWWAFGLMLAAAASPVYWGVLTALIRSSDPEAQLRTALVLAVAVPAVVVGAAALVRPDSRSLALVVLAALVVLEIAWVVFFVTAFGSGLLGLCIVSGTGLATLAGVLLARRGSPPR